MRLRDVQLRGGDAPEVLIPSLKKRLQTRMRTPLRVPGFRTAAVLVPLLHTDYGWQLLFTVRALHLTHHPGQIAFPGGKLEPQETVQTAALRECVEEIGLNVSPLSVVGLLDDQLSPAGFVVTPVVVAQAVSGKVLSGLRLLPAEVEDVFWVPLAELQALTPHQEARSVRGFTRILHDYRWRQRRIWGLTGNVLADMLEVLQNDEVVPKILDNNILHNLNNNNPSNKNKNAEVVGVVSGNSIRMVRKDGAVDAHDAADSADSEVAAGMLSDRPPL